MCDIVDLFHDDPPPPPPGPSAAQLAAEAKKKRDKATRDAIVSDAVDTDRRRGRGATVFSGGQNAQSYGFGTYLNDNPVGLASFSQRTKLGY